MNRREVLGLAGASTTAGLAGCIGGGCGDIPEIPRGRRGEEVTVKGVVAGKSGGRSLTIEDRGRVPQWVPVFSSDPRTASVQVREERQDWVSENVEFGDCVTATGTFNYQAGGFDVLIREASVDLTNG